MNADLAGTFQLMEQRVGMELLRQRRLPTITISQTMELVEALNGPAADSIWFHFIGMGAVVEGGYLSDDCTPRLYLVDPSPPLLPATDTLPYQESPNAAGGGPSIKVKSEPVDRDDCPRRDSDDLDGLDDPTVSIVVDCDVPVRRILVQQYLKSAPPSTGNTPSAPTCSIYDAEDDDRPSAPETATNVPDWDVFFEEKRDELLLSLDGNVVDVVGCLQKNGLGAPQVLAHSVRTRGSSVGDYTRLMRSISMHQRGLKPAEATVFVEEMRRKSDAGRLSAAEQEASQASTSLANLVAAMAVPLAASCATARSLQIAYDGSTSPTNARISAEAPPTCDPSVVVIACEAATRVPTLPVSTLDEAVRRYIASARSEVAAKSSHFQTTIQTALEQRHHEGSSRVAEEGDGEDYRLVAEPEKGALSWGEVLAMPIASPPASSSGKTKLRLV